ncbi:MULTISPECIES: transcriptional regulator [unclassified Serratia (in: enterobacteria)]|uniref:transcriptional regulator n=1 Tax=unclassified Serratia (in: enterobacteria) TaxID=2647522 RepID=UPI00046A0B52|nr:MULTISPECIES: transcriptional regulator [unclassified Serratia (in: enterobacteria)]
MKEKALEGSFDSHGKEPFNVRLKQLLNGRTVKEASDDWGIKLSTIKNYFSRPESKPRYGVLSKIANCEGVSIEWLLGDSGSVEENRIPQMNSGRDWRDRLVDMLNLLSDEELEALTKQLMRKGVETILQLLDEDNIKYLQLPDEERERLMALHEAKKGASEDNQDNELSRPTHKAG